MRGWAETAVFLGLAAAVHAAVIVTAFEGAGDGSSDAAGGAATLTLAAVPADLARVVEDWTAPPETAPAPGRPAAPVPESRPSAVGGEAARPVRAPAPVPFAGATEDAPLASRPAPLAARPALAALLPVQPEVPRGADRVTLPAPATDALRRPNPTVPPVIRAGPPEAPPSTGAVPLPARALSPPPARPALVAKGPGQGERAAEQAPTDAAVTRVRPEGASRAAVHAWGAAIRSRIDARKSPPTGRWAPGQAVLRITVARDGRVAGARVLRSSGDPRLDRAALRAVARAGRMPQAPDGFAPATADFDLPVIFGR